MGRIRERRKRNLTFWGSRVTAFLPQQSPPHPSRLTPFVALSHAKFEIVPRKRDFLPSEICEGHLSILQPVERKSWIKPGESLGCPNASASMFSLSLKGMNLYLAYLFVLLVPMDSVILLNVLLNDASSLKYSHSIQYPMGT